MNDTLILGAFVLILLAAVSFYFYSRILYSERKIGLLESILLDIKMNIEMEDDRHEHEHLPGVVPISNKIVESNSEDAAFYSSILEEVQKEASQQADLGDSESLPSSAPWAGMSFPPGLGPTGSDEQTVATSPEPDSHIQPEVNYEAMTRDELSTLADKRGLRATKRMSKQNVISLLREADKNTYSGSQSGSNGFNNGPSGASTGIISLEGSADGAPLDISSGEGNAVEVKL